MRIIWYLLGFSRIEKEGLFLVCSGGNGHEGFLI